MTDGDNGKIIDNNVKLTASASTNIDATEVDVTEIDAVEIDEIIDTTEYTKDTRDFIITDDAVDLIMADRVNGSSQKDIGDAFRFLRSNNLVEFRKIIGRNRFIVNNKHNKTFLVHEACRLGNVEFVSLLLFLGAQCTIMDDNGFMAQHYAVKSKSTVVVDILFLFGFNMNVRDSKGNSPFYYALMDENVEMINVLMIYKADPMIKNLAGFTLKDYLEQIKFKKTEIINILTKYIDEYN